MDISPLNNLTQTYTVPRLMSSIKGIKYLIPSIKTLIKKHSSPKEMSFTIEYEGAPTSSDFIYYFVKPFSYYLPQLKQIALYKSTDKIYLCRHTKYPQDNIRSIVTIIQVFKRYHMSYLYFLALRFSRLNKQLPTINRANPRPKPR